MSKEGYYWAKHNDSNEGEVIHITKSSINNDEVVWRLGVAGVYHKYDFDWIDDEPIPEKKMPMKLVDNGYYVIRNDRKPFVGKWDEGMECFHGGCQNHYPTNVTVISGPFYIDQLICLKPS